MNVFSSSREVPVVHVRFNLNLNFLERFSKNTQISNLLKIRPVGAELFYAHRRTDMTKLIVAYRNFVNAPKILLSKRRVCFCVVYSSEKNNRGIVT